MFNGAFLLGLIILAACVWWACRTAPVQPGEYSRLDRADGLGDHALIEHTITASGVRRSWWTTRSDTTEVPR